MTVFRGECQIKIDLESDKNLSKICLLHNLIVEYFYNTPQVVDMRAFWWATGLCKNGFRFEALITALM